MPHAHIDVRYVANLARLELTDSEVATFQSQLDSILTHVESLTNLDIPPNLAPQNENTFGKMRDDIPHPSLDSALVLQNAPDQAQSQIRVPKVVIDA